MYEDLLFLSPPGARAMRSVPIAAAATTKNMNQYILEMQNTNNFSKPNIMSLKNKAIWNIIGSIAPMLIGLFCIPYLIKNIGLEVFGILTLVWALIGYFSIFDFGIGRALTHQVSSNLSESLTVNLPGIVKAGLIFTSIFGVFGGVLLAATAHQFGYKWLNVSESLQKSTTSCLMIASLGIPLATLVSGLKGVLEGYEDFKLTNILRVLFGFANFGFPTISVVLFGPSLEYMVISLVLARLIILFAHIIPVSCKLSNWISSQILSKKKLIELLSFGAWMSLSNIISPLMVTSDRFIISYMLGASLVAYYTVPFDIIIRLLVIPAALTTALFPRFTYLFINNKNDIKRLYMKSLNTLMAIMLMICALIFISSYWGLSIWLGKEFAQKSWLIASILSVGLYFNSLAQVPHAAVQASGDIRATSLIHLVEFVLYVPLLIISLRYYGLIGAALVWVFRVMVDYILLSALARKYIS